MASLKRERPHVLSQDLFLGDENAKSGSDMTSAWHTAGLGACDIARRGTSCGGRWEGTRADFYNVFFSSGKWVTQKLTSLFG